MRPAARDRDVRPAFAGLAALLLVGGLACRMSPGPTASLEPGEGERLAAVARLSPPPPVPPDETNAVADDPRAAQLGQYLFFAGGLSSRGDVSCATCHDPTRAFTDGRARAEALGKGTRNTPSVLNTAYNRWFFWDGRADSAWAQAAVPIEHPLEMGGDRLAVTHWLAADGRLAAAYEALFGPLPDLADADRFPAHARPVPDDPTHPHHEAWERMRPDDRRAASAVLANVGKALAAYQRRLVTRGSPFDRFVAGLAGEPGGERAALSTPARRGLSLFVGRAGCTLCHSGPLLTDGEFHATGAPSPDGSLDAGRYEGAAHVLTDPFNAAGAYSDDPDGRRALALKTLRRRPDAWGEFKTPGLRNVAHTAPYMHAGQLPDLHAVVRFYSTLEGAVAFDHHGESVLTPLSLDEEEIDDLVAFLVALTDEPLPPELLTQPESP